MRPNLRLLACGLAATALSLSAAAAFGKGGGQITGWNPAPVSGSSKLAPGVKPIGGVHAVHGGSTGGGGKNGGQVSGFSVFTPPSFAGNASTMSAPGGLQRTSNGAVVHGTVPAGSMGMLAAMPTARASGVGAQGVGNSLAPMQGVGNSQGATAAAAGGHNSVVLGRKQANAAVEAEKAAASMVPGALPVSSKACAGKSGGASACK